MKYLKQFVVGSSVLVFISFLYNVYSIIQNDTDYYNKLSQSPQPWWWPLEINFYSYFTYSLLAPLWFGIWNIISLILAEQLNLSTRYRFILISIISSISIITIVTTYKLYNYTTIDEWIKYSIIIFINYMILWNIIIYNIEKNM